MRNMVADALAQILGLAIATWKGVIARVDGPKKPEGGDDEDDVPEPLPLDHQPSADAMEVMGDFREYSHSHDSAST